MSTYYQSIDRLKANFPLSRRRFPRTRIPVGKPFAPAPLTAHAPSRVAIALLIVLLSACAQVRVSNEPLARATGPNYSFDDWLTAQAWPKSPLKEGRNLIVLSFSGGGVRAATLAASVLEQLRFRGLSQDIAVISSTSGGSVTAGFVAAHGVAEVPKLETNFLYRDNTAYLGPRLLPSILTGANRSQIFADYLDEQLVGNGTSGLTYDDLIGRWKTNPFVILNASDVSTAQTFEFTQETFDWLCSDLNSFRISEAIAASAAFPFLMTPIPLRNQWDTTPCQERPNSHRNSDYVNAWKTRYVNLEQFVLARHIHSLRYSYTKKDPDGRPPYREIEFVHLLDGGLSDNLAARALLRLFGKNLLKLRDRGVQRILLIQVNAKSESKRAIDKSVDPPSIFEVFESVALNPIDVVTTLSAYASREYTISLVQHANIGVAPERRIIFYPVQVDFDLLETGSAEQANAKDIATWWSLPHSQIDLLKDVGKKLLEDHACFRDFIADTRNIGSSSSAQPSEPREKCSGFINVAFEERIPPAPGVVPSPPPRPVPAPAPKPAPVAGKVTLAADVLFDFDKSVLKPEGKNKLDDLAQRIKAVRLEVVITIGHTDSIGSDAYNQKLSMRRAESVKAYLVSRGVDPSRIYTEGKGEKQPVESNKTKEGRAKNRRVEIEVIGTRK